MIMIERLKAARKACKFTQQQIADMLGIDRSTYSYYETGRTHPPMENLVKLAAIFNTDVLWIVGESRKESVLCKSDDVLTIKAMIHERGITQLTEDERKLVALYRMLREDGKEQELEKLQAKVKSK